MSMNDPIADMLTRMRNALMRQHADVMIPHSTIKVAIAEVMKSEGYISDYNVLEQSPGSLIRVKLKYVGNRRERHSVITGLERVSKTGRRVYVGGNEVPWVLSGMGTAILTTSKGVMSGQQARRQGIGGEVLCKVW